MKQRLLSTTLTTVAVTLSITFLTHQPSYAEDTTFSCLPPGEQLNGELLNSYTLTARTPRTFDIPLITWENPDFRQWRNNNNQEYDPNIRCEEVAQKLQRYYQCELLEPEYITSATFPWTENNQTSFYPVILTVHPELGQSQCSEANTGAIRGLLFMLPPEKDINQAAAKAKGVLDQLQDLRFYAVESAIKN